MKEEKEKISLPFLIIGIIAIWIIATVIIWFVFKDWSKSGTFGDTFGAINSLFSGLALAGIIYTIYLQKTELSLQRKELEYTRLELKRTADAQESSGKLMTEQLRINNFPLIDYRVENDVNKRASIKIINLIDKPAYDLDIWIYLTTDIKSIPLDRFLNENVKRYKNKYQFLKDNLVDGFQWCINDRAVYSYLPREKSIAIDLERYEPFVGKLIYIFIQYRDVLGNNYQKVTGFIRKRSISPPYFMYSNNPIKPEMKERVDLSKKEDISKTGHEALEALHKSAIFAHHIDFIELRVIQDKWRVVNRI